MIHHVENNNNMEIKHLMYSLIFHNSCSRHWLPVVTIPEKVKCHKLLYEVYHKKDCNINQKENIRTHQS
jgi:hypothetical protein